MSILITIIFDDDWIDIPAGQSRTFGFALDKGFSFLPGENIYNIGSLEYYVTNEQWIRRKRIYRIFFDAMGFRTDQCSLVGGDYFFQKTKIIASVEITHLILNIFYEDLNWIRAWKECILTLGVIESELALTGVM